MKPLLIMMMVSFLDVSLGAWTEWGAFSVCTKTCGSGSRSRFRVCQLRPCPGAKQYNQVCNAQACPLGSPTARSGAWHEWGAFGACSKTCGGGLSSRRRACFGASNCPGSAEHQHVCNAHACPVGIWSQWTPFSACSKTCGGGTQTRTRPCIGTGCAGQSKESRPCHAHACPIGSWMAWSPWTTVCTKVCGVDGELSRRRVCVGGGVCPGLALETRPCNRVSCLLYHMGHWSEWQPWTVCSRTCLGGEQIRRRVCIAGTQCPGAKEQKRACNMQPCLPRVPAPGGGRWSPWRFVGPCVPACGPAVRKRVRNCIGPNVCLGFAEENTACVNKPCP